MKNFAAKVAAGGTLDTFNPEKAREAYQKYTEKGRSVVDEMRSRSEGPASVESVTDTLGKLAQLRDAGELTQDEYNQLKAKLLERAV